MNNMKNRRASLVFEPSDYYSKNDISVDGVRGKMWLVDEEQDVVVGDKVWYKSGGNMVAAKVVDIKENTIKLDYLSGHALCWTSKRKLDLIIGGSDNLRYQKSDKEIDNSFVFSHNFYKVEYITDDMLVKIYKDHTLGYLRLLTNLKVNEDGEMNYILENFNDSFIYYP